MKKKERKKKSKEPKAKKETEIDTVAEIESEAGVIPDGLESITRSSRKKREVPIWERSLLTIYEASDYTGIGINKLRMIASNPNTGLILYIGSKRMLKRKKLDEYLDRAVSI